MRVCRTNWMHFGIRTSVPLLLILNLSSHCRAQEQGEQIRPPADTKASTDSAETERWNLFGQSTSIGQYHGTFHSPYSGPFSLQNYMERDVSLTTTLFFGLRLA